MLGIKAFDMNTFGIKTFGIKTFGIYTIKKYTLFNATWHKDIFDEATWHNTWHITPKKVL
jgi:hypothetical protein